MRTALPLILALGCDKPVMVPLVAPVDTGEAGSTSWTTATTPSGSSETSSTTGTSSGTTSTPEVPFCSTQPGGLALWTDAPFVSSAAEPTRTLSIPTSGTETFAKLTVDLDLTFEGWDAVDPSGTHAVFQLTRSETWRSNLYGYMTLFGPGTNKAKVISNIDLAAGEVTRLERTGVTLDEGTTYHVHYTYDAAFGERRLLITDGLDVVVHIADGDVASEVTALAPAYELILGSDHNPNGPEVLTDGWVFDDVCVQLIP